MVKKALTATLLDAIGFEMDQINKAVVTEVLQPAEPPNMAPLTWRPPSGTASYGTTTKLVKPPLRLGRPCSTLLMSASFCT
jgi:hypothetical protein